MDEPLVWYEGSGTSDRRFLHADERGSVIALSSGTGGIIAINAYDEYGIPASTNLGRFGYTGQTWLPEIGMHYYKARIYSPTLGRFMQTDPIGYGDGMNWYAYVGGDPVNGRDPSGNQCAGVEGFVTCSGGGLNGALPSQLGGLPPASFTPGYAGATNVGQLQQGMAQYGAKPPKKKEPPKREPFDPAKDYCGSTGSEGVPDGNWSEACKAHDECYGTPGAIKEVCDAKLARDMTAACSGKIYVPALCAIPGVLYGGSLMILGWTPFWHPSRDAYNAAQGQ